MNVGATPRFIRYTNIYHTIARGATEGPVQRLCLVPGKHQYADLTKQSLPLHFTALTISERRVPGSPRLSMDPSANVPSKPPSYHQTVSPANAARFPQEHRGIRAPAFKPSLKRPIKRDAYAAFPESPDAAWDTLSVDPRKRARQTQAAPTKAKTFSIPMLTGPSSKVHPPPAGRKRPMYRPPPREGTASRVSATPSAAHASGSHSGASSVSGLNAAVSGSRNEAPRLFRPVVTVYTPLSPVSSPARPTDRNREIHARASLPSPPASDPVLEADVPSVRYEPLKIRYAGMKRRIAERKRVPAQLWECLGLPSCGVVYQDPSPSSSRNKQDAFELPICVWGRDETGQA
ncbi:hypothetical protein FOMPIDRAFT_1018824 [Fomitopsis schrenkii]|uniref:Uncharacterized protein n=1 Tax=Fomitopsis schrenkii TaxID=2126942 RepID=S8FD85_FOMSC|nr:hypothetical protein FOMPIDRAFT_1018824 [Fomitopsis schrenkii]